MGQRLDLQEKLEEITAHVYFQPPTNNRIQYPCIVYEVDYAKTEHADNRPYTYTRRYQVTVIDRDPDSVIPKSVAMFPMCLLNRFFTADGLNHTVYTLYF